MKPGQINAFHIPNSPIIMINGRVALIWSKSVNILPKLGYFHCSSQDTYIALDIPYASFNYIPTNDELDDVISRHEG